MEIPLYVEMLFHLATRKPKQPQPTPSKPDKSSVLPCSVHSSQYSNLCCTWLGLSASAKPRTKKCSRPPSLRLISRRSACVPRRLFQLRGYWVSGRNIPNEFLEHFRKRSPEMRAKVIWQRSLTQNHVQLFKVGKVFSHPHTIANHDSISLRAGTSLH